MRDTGAILVPTRTIVDDLLAIGEQRGTPAYAMTKLRDLASDTMIQVGVDERQDRVTELFDKYNLLTLPVVDEDGKLAGVITADDIISVLRSK